jgi:hypothetical protein
MQRSNRESNPRPSGSTNYAAARPKLVAGEYKLQESRPPPPAALKHQAMVFSKVAQTFSAEFQELMKIILLSKTVELVSSGEYLYAHLGAQTRNITFLKNRQRIQTTLHIACFEQETFDRGLSQNIVKIYVSL